MVGADAEPVAPVATSGQAASRSVRVDGRNRWTDTGIMVRAGQVINFDARGTVRLGPNDSDVAGVDGLFSGRRDNNAPMGNQPTGGLIARIGNSPSFWVGDGNSLRAPAAGRLYLGVNDNSLADNAGDFQVVVDVEP